MENFVLIKLNNWYLKFASSNVQLHTAAMETCESTSAISGYHIYHRIWNAVVGEVINCQRKKPSKDGYTEAILRMELYNRPCST